METSKNRSTKFLFVFICFYRFLFITFGGISLDQNGNIIKSKFWNIYGWIGCCFYSLSILHFIYTLFTYDPLKQMNDSISVFWALLIIWPFIAVSVLITTVFINQKFGFKIIKIFIKHSLVKFGELQSVIIIWILYLIVNVVIFIAQSAVYQNARITIGSFGSSLVVMPTITSILFISWMVSVGFSENIKIVRNYLTDNVMSIRTYQLTHANKLLLINYKLIEKIDHYLAFAFIFSAIGIMMSIMSLVYLGLYANKVPVVIDLITFNMPNVILQVINLILNCFFNGKISEETQKLLSDLDNFNISTNDERLFKALILLRKSVHKVKCGFTIGGFAPWNKLSLLQVTSCL